MRATKMEIKEEESTPILPPDSPTQPPKVEVKLYREGKGPIDVIKCPLVGFEQDQLDVGSILDKYNLKSIYAFKPGSGRGVPVRFNPRNGRSILPYKNGSVIHVDGEPKDSLMKPVTRILVGVCAMSILIVLVMKESPQWAKNFNFSMPRIPPWILACAVIVFTRIRKRTKHFLEKRR
ncbi:hypothetical protein LIER_06690 [Lithospermum erythrorhizon]|uniref:Uncharacterized protein n=1 Tax=Lithospermum erythrorhizon TaxID=34254 RepID=A0AAV3P768_LITER